MLSHSRGVVVRKIIQKAKKKIIYLHKLENKTAIHLTLPKLHTMMSILYIVSLYANQEVLFTFVEFFFLEVFCWQTNGEDSFFIRYCQWCHAFKITTFFSSREAGARKKMDGKTCSVLLKLHESGWYMTAPRHKESSRTFTIKCCTWKGAQVSSTHADYYFYFPS